MSQPRGRQWLVLSLCGAVGMLGCEHASQHCDCVSTVAPATSVVMLPTPTPQPALVSAPAVDLGSPTKADPMIEPTVAKKVEPPTGTVTVPLIAGGEGGGRIGMVELSAADAEAMGVRPGRTPGALYIPPQ